MQSITQITGNPHVKDCSAIYLDAKAVSTMIGKWKLVRSVTYIHKEELVSDRRRIIDFDQQGGISTSWCVDCHQVTTGHWMVHN